jgi:hypothetical protein
MYLPFVFLLFDVFAKRRFGQNSILLISKRNGKNISTIDSKQLVD